MSCFTYPYFLTGNCSYPLVPPSEYFVGELFPSCEPSDSLESVRSDLLMALNSGFFVILKSSQDREYIGDFWIVPFHFSFQCDFSDFSFDQLLELVVIVDSVY